MNVIFKTGKTILEALAFANADNHSECKALLRQLGDAHDAGDCEAADELFPGAMERTAVSIRPAQGMM